MIITTAIGVYWVSVAISLCLCGLSIRFRGFITIGESLFLAVLVFTPILNIVAIVFEILFLLCWGIIAVADWDKFGITLWRRK